MANFNAIEREDPGFIFELDCMLRDIKRYQAMDALTADQQAHLEFLMDEVERLNE